jgi:sirohydrochlorin ferrochelatase
VANRDEALLVMVHGSPKPEANEDMFAVVDEIRRRDIFSVVRVGFMECNAPTIPEAIAECVATGARRVIAVPYFLHIGTHVADDLPRFMEEARKMYPEVDFMLGRAIGQSPKITEVLAHRIAEVPE